MKRRYWTAEHEVLIDRHSAAAGLHRCGLSRRDDCLHPSRDNLLSTKAIAMRGGEWMTGPAALDECRNLGFVSRPEAIDELG